MYRLIDLTQIRRVKDTRRWVKETKEDPKLLYVGDWEKEVANWK